MVISFFNEHKACLYVLEPQTRANCRQNIQRLIRIMIRVVIFVFANMCKMVDEVAHIYFSQ